MGSWIRLLGLLGAVALAALVLKQLPPLLVLAMILGGVVYANHVLTTKPKRDRARGTAELLGLRTVPLEEASIAALPFALLARPGAAAREVMAGTWRGASVRLFDLETTSAEPVADAEPTRRYTCAIAPLAADVPHLIVEPQAFLTPAAERSALPVAGVPSERVASAFDVRCADPAFAASFVDGDLEAWLLGQEERVAFEVVGHAALLYERAIPLKDRDLLLEALHGFLDALPVAGRKTQA